MSATVQVNATSTAIAWVMMGIKSNIASTDNELRTLYDIIALNTKVQELASYIDALQKSDFEKWSDRSNASLKQKFQDALSDILGQPLSSSSSALHLASGLKTGDSLITISQTPHNDNIYVNDIKYGYLSNSKLTNGSVTLVNDTKLFMSVEARSKESNTIVNGYKHVDDILNMDQKTLIGPKGWGLLGISSAKEIELEGVDSELEIVIGSYGGTTDKETLADVLLSHLDGVAHGVRGLGG